MGNDNEARCHLITYRLPNRFEPKTTASATGEKSIPSVAWSVKESHCKIEIINDRQREWMCGVATSSPVVIRVLSAHLLDTNLVQKPGRTPSPPDWECNSKTKPRVINYLTASFSAIYFLWKSKEQKTEATRFFYTVMCEKIFKSPENSHAFSDKQSIKQTNTIHTLYSRNTVSISSIYLTGL